MKKVKIEDGGEQEGSLGEYARKRDFAATPEPAPERRRRKRTAPRFVVQEHSARRLHWDLRLEHDGVLASWAIPNGIPVDPEENRKAVHTEDHPLEYLDFEGEIPAGEYGAGTMTIWDRGTYEPEKWEEGKVVLRFAGERLRGRYALFRAGKNEKDWMIHRIDPPEEVRDPFPESVVPMLAKPAALPARDEGWATEVKWDGVRAIAYCRPGRLELQTRNLNVVTSQYPEVRRLSRQLGARDAVLDGELVAFDADGRPSFERLQQRIHQTDANVVRRRMKTHPVTYVLFDLLYLDGRDLTGEPYRRRHELLEGLGLEGESWQTPGYAVGHAEELLAASAAQDLEGIVLKRLDSRYSPGKRNGSWLKVKTVGRQEFVIGGWAAGEGRRRNRLGAILLGAYDEAGKLQYAGKVGTGFSERDLDELLERLRPLARESNPFAKRRGPRDANFVEPELVAEVEFRELTAEGMVRHGSFKGLRDDKPAPQVELERVASEVERPTALVLALTPGPPADVLDCAQVALWIRGMFEQLGLNSYAMTSGSGALQVYAPLNAEVTDERTKPFAKAVAETLATKFPDRVVAGTTKQAGKVLIDWSQNDRREATVSIPVEWEELEAALEAGDADRLVFDQAEVLRRVERRGELFASMLSERQELPEV
jgi:bifunctional non-homologous end joining protein LigD